jgi:hypothetical protein
MKIRGQNEFLEVPYIKFVTIQLQASCNQIV